MAKRFTDTDKWNHAWFRRLTPKMKCVWNFLCDRCDHAGLWIADFESLSFHIGEEITAEEVERVFTDKIRKLAADKYFVTGFVDFQYGELNPDNRVHKSVILKLEKEGAYKPLRSPLEGAKDKDKDKEKEKEKEKEEFEEKKPKSAAELFEASFEFDYKKLFARYPRNQKRTESLKLMAEHILDRETYDELARACDAYREHCRREETAFKHILTFPNFWLEWRDWLDPAMGTSDIVVEKSQADLSAIPWDGPGGAN